MSFSLFSLVGTIKVRMNTAQNIHLHSGPLMQALVGTSFDSLCSLMGRTITHTTLPVDLKRITAGIMSNHMSEIKDAD